MAATLMDGARFELLLEDSEVEEFKTSLSELELEVSGDPDLPENVKEAARSVIQELKKGFAGYKVSGAEGIASALAKAYGTWVLNIAILGTPASQPPESLVLKIWGAIRTGHSTLSIVKDSYAAGAAIASLGDLLG